MAAANAPARPVPTRPALDVRALVAFFAITYAVSWAWGIPLGVGHSAGRARSARSRLGAGSLMNRRQPFGIWVRNHVANPVMRPLLRSRFGRRLGKQIALIRYRGRRSGRAYELPVQYARDDSRVWILAGSPKHKVWWRNLRGGAEVELLLAGRPAHGKAVALVGAHHPDQVAEGLAAYVRAMPRARRSLGLSAGRPTDWRDTNVRRIIRDIVLVRSTLPSGPAAKG